MSWWDGIHALIKFNSSGVCAMYIGLVKSYKEYMSVNYQYTSGLAEILVPIFLPAHQGPGTRATAQMSATQRVSWYIPRG